VREGMRIDPVSLGSGVIVAALGLLMLLDSTGVVDVSLGWIAVALTAAVGGMLLLSGLANGSAGRHD
jgi:hypothetical protein